MPIKIFSQCSVPIAGDGSSTSVDIDLKKLPPLVVNLLPTSKLLSATCFGGSGPTAVPAFDNATIKGTTVTLNFASAFQAFDSGNPTNTFYTLALAFTYETT
jgi:hypothetical protein